MALLASLAVLAWPHGPRPAGPAPSVEDALAADIASAAGHPVLSPEMIGRLGEDLRRAKHASPPPEPSRAEIWRAILGQVRTALGEAQSDPSAAREALESAGLEMPLVSSQPQSTGTGGPEGPAPS